MKNNKIIQAVIFDLSGTLVDFGSLATIDTMKKVFQSKGISINNEIIKKDMGIKKKYHIKKILSYPLIKSEWIKKYKKPINSIEFNELCIKFDKYLPLIVKKNLNIIPNVKKIFRILQKNKIKIGATTGYPKRITKIILKFLKNKKIHFDNCVSEDEVSRSRPEPDMCIKNLKTFKIKDPKNCIKIDDSISGILEGKNSGMFTIGLVSTGIQLGLSKSDFKNKNIKFKRNEYKKIRKRFRKSGASFVALDHYELENIFKKKFFIN